MTLYGVYEEKELPPAIDEQMVNEYEWEAYSGGGSRYDAVLEYRVWAKDDRGLGMMAFATYKEAIDLAVEEYAKGYYYIHVMALVRQDWIPFLDGEGNLVIDDEPRQTEWDPEWVLTSVEFSQLTQDEVRALSTEDKKRYLGG